MNALTASMVMYQNTDYAAQKNTSENVLDFNEIVETVATYFNTTPYEMIYSGRSKKELAPRILAMWFLKQIAKCYLVDIGRYFNKDHTTVIHARRVMLDMLSTSSSDIYQKYHLELCELLSISYQDDFDAAITESRMVSRRKNKNKVKQIPQRIIPYNPKKTYSKPPAIYSNHSPFRIASVGM